MSLTNCPPLPPVLAKNLFHLRYAKTAMSTESTDKVFNFPTYAVFYKGLLHAVRDLGFHLYTPQPSWACCGILGDRKEKSDCPVQQLNLSDGRPDLDSTH